MIAAGLETHEADLYRPGLTKHPEGDRTQGWSDPVVTSGVLLQVAHASAGRVQREFGLAIDAEYLLVADEGYDVRIDDVLKLTQGPFGVGQNVKVVDARRRPELECWVLAGKVQSAGPA